MPTRARATIPYSQPLEGGTNYLRNSVKVTVDAFTGRRRSTPSTRTTRSSRRGATIFPTLITDGDKIPPAIREHFRYPQGLFTAQAEVYRTYHMTDVDVFYNKEDQWEIPGERQGKTDGAVLRSDAAAGRRSASTSTSCSPTRRATVTT